MGKLKKLPFKIKIKRMSVKLGSPSSPKSVMDVHEQSYMNTKENITGWK